MLRREDSNKVLKRVKAIVFATSLSLLNPVNVEAKEVVSCEIQDYSNELDSASKFYFSILGGLVIGSISVGIIGYYSLKNTANIDLIQGQLSDEESKDDIGEAVKCLKITNE